MVRSVNTNGENQLLNYDKCSTVLDQQMREQPISVMDYSNFLLMAFRQSSLVMNAYGFTKLSAD